MENKTLKILRVGDPHVMVSNLKESEALLEFIVKTARKLKVDQVEFMGDLFDTHSVIRLQVMDFWDRWFCKLDKEKFNTLVLVGNHDCNGDKETENSVNSLNVFKGKVKVSIVDVPMIFDRMLYIPYTGSPERFLDITKEYSQTNLVVAHQTFIGAMYESGFPAPDGIDIDSVPQDAIISGHIHRSQQVGKVFYTGAPRWLKSTDADSEKGIWFFEHNIENPSLYIKHFIPTKDVVIPMYKITLKEGDEEPSLPDNAKIALELIGESSWISKMKKKYKGKASIRGMPVDRKASTVDRSKLLNIEDFIQGYKKESDLFDLKDLIEYVRVI